MLWLSPSRVNCSPGEKERMENLDTAIKCKLVMGLAIRSCNI